MKKILLFTLLITLVSCSSSPDPEPESRPAYDVPPVFWYEL